MSLFSIFLFLGILQDRPPDTTQTWHFGSYRVEQSNKVIGSNGYRVFKDGEQVFAADPPGFNIISVSKGKQVYVNEPTVSDITGDGVPDLIIEEFPRNPGCCFSYSIFSLGKTFRTISRLTDLGTSLTFQDINRDTIYEIVGEDWSFLSRYANPRIVFGYRNGQYQLATSMMRRSPPTPETLLARSRKPGTLVPPPGSAVSNEVYAYMVELIYAGNAQSAWQFLDLSWPKGKPGKKEFQQEFLAELQKSPFWSSIRSMNGTALH